MKGTKKYWKGIEELNNDPEFLQYRDQEFVNPTEEELKDEDSGKTSRRDFLKSVGFGVAAVSLAACEAPVRKVIPYIHKPVDVDPGLANYYASCYVSGSIFNSVLVRTREGRPVLVEGNREDLISRGGVDSKVVASTLDLYDTSRLTTFLKDGNVISISKADKEIKAALGKSNSVAVLSQSVLSPSLQAAINEFSAKYSAKHIKYDPLSASGLLEAYGGFIPSYDFSKADVIASVNADFLGTWISPTEFSQQYIQTRQVRKGKDAKQNMSRHYHFETTMTLSGASADFREMIKPSEEGKYLVALYNAIAKAKGSSTYNSEAVSNPVLDKCAKDLIKAGKKGLVVAGSNDLNVQLVAKAINELLGNEGVTVDTANQTYLKQGDDKEFVTFVKDLAKGKFDAVILLDANPLYNSTLSADIKAGLDKTKLVISLADRVDETAELANYVCPDTHCLESWGDANPKNGYYALMQPTISPIFPEGNREAGESFLSWADNKTEYYEYVRSYWKNNLFPLQSRELIFESFWEKTLQVGVVSFNEAPASISTSDSISIGKKVDATVVGGLTASILKAASSSNATGIELSVYESVQFGNGKGGNNPWLFELPDPISKVTWDNYLAISVLDVDDATSNIKELVNIKDGDIVTLTANGITNKVPVLIQPGQAGGTVSVASGYGRTKAGKLQDGVMYKNADGEAKIGFNAFPYTSVSSTGAVSFETSGVTIAVTGEKHKIARTQTHQTIMGRSNVQETTLAEYVKNAGAGRVHPMISTSEGLVEPKKIDGWVVPTRDEDGNLEEGVTHKYENHHWALAIDLNACTGCSACVVSCHAENNVPIVGKDEVLRSRDMHWLRIDRYYSSQPELDHGKYNAKEHVSYTEMENPAANPEVVFQPMMCQHCNHAPCETVCPVLATTHSSEGLNQMTYNRCIGTRYCANNCPYKVRRFNWFNYSDSTSDREFKSVNTPSNTDLGKMVLNPDVTVRARGVMEKCSMCVQRIQAGKLKAKMEKRKLRDDDVEGACSSVCPTGGLVFGDMNDPNSKISKVLNVENSERAFHVLEEINVKPNVSYLTKIRNKG